MTFKSFSRWRIGSSRLSVSGKRSPCDTSELQNDRGQTLLNAVAAQLAAHTVDIDEARISRRSGARAEEAFTRRQGTFCTKLCRANLPSDEVAEVMGWSPQQVLAIRRTYVDREAVVVAIADRLRGRL